MANGQKEQTGHTGQTTTIEPKNLAARMAISPKRLRAMLRADYPRVAEVKGKRWEIPMDQAKKIQEAYKAKKAEAGKAKQAEIQKELKGEAK